MCCPAFLFTITSDCPERTRSVPRPLGVSGPDVLQERGDGLLVVRLARDLPALGGLVVKVVEVPLHGLVVTDVEELICDVGSSLSFVAAAAEVKVPRFADSLCQFRIIEQGSAIFLI